jgi:hypothetical protein
METFKDFVRNVYEIRKGMTVKSSYLKPTTITLCARNVCGIIDAKKIRKIFKDVGPFTTRFKNASKGFTWDIQKSKKSVQFYNSVSITYQDALSKKSIKMFKNGSIQIAGCTNSLDCNVVIKHLSVILPLILNKDIKIKRSDFKTVMFNAVFKMPQKIHLYNLYRVLQTDPDFEVSYDPGSYHGMSVKYNGTHIKLFTTGSVTISCSSAKSCYEAYEAIEMRIGEECRVGPVFKIPEDDIIYGYTFEQWLK